MNGTSCEQVAELLPEYAAGTLPPGESAVVAAHLAMCEECRADMEIVRHVRASRPDVPTDLATRIRGAIRFRRNVVPRPWWGVAAAAVAALAIGIGVAAERGRTVEASVPAYASDPGSDVWLTNDGLVAGAPVLDGLSDQALEQLLKEMAQWKTGA